MGREECSSNKNPPRVERKVAFLEGIEYIYPIKFQKLAIGGL